MKKVILPKNVADALSELKSVGWTNLEILNLKDEIPTSYIESTIESFLAASPSNDDLLMTALVNGYREEYPVRIENLRSYYESINVLTPSHAQRYMRQAVEEVVAILGLSIEDIPYSKRTINSENFRKKYDINIEMLTNEQLDAIRKRAEAATEGPWYYDNQTGDLIEINTGKYPKKVLADEATGVFLANAREDVPALLAEVERLQQRLSLAEDLLSEAHDLLDDVHCYETETYEAITQYFDGGDNE